MPETPQTPPRTATIEELLKAANVPVTPTPPPAPSQETTTGAQGSVVIGQDGRRLYKYDTGTETYLFSKPIEQMTEQDFYNLPISLYDSQPGRLPQNLTVTFKDPQWAGYWFNKKANQGSRVSTARSLGYVPAKKEDLASYSVELNDEDGAIEQHDLVLMKIHKAQLYMQYKQWLDKAKHLGGVDAYKGAANQSLDPANRAKSPYYISRQAREEFQGVGPVTNLPTVGDR